MTFSGKLKKTSDEQSGTTGVGDRRAVWRASNRKLRLFLFKTAQVAPVSEILLHGRECWTVLR
jgi:hypothetical protein